MKWKPKEIKPMKLKDFERNISKAKTFDEYNRAATELHEYIDWIKNSEKRLSKHLGKTIWTVDI